MAKIWKEDANVNEHPNRNNFDLRYQNHLTMKMGGIYPIMCKEVVPGDTFTIDTAFGLKFMPLVFPVQSRMRAHVSYFYVPNRILWDNWKNFISGLETHDHPYISQPTSWFKTGSLCDYLDVPTTTVGSNIRTVTASVNSNTFTTHINARGVGANAGSYLGNTRGTVQVSDVVDTSISGLYSHGLRDDVLNGIDPTGSVSWNHSVDYAAYVGSQLPLYFFDVPLNTISLSPESRFSFEVANNVPSDSCYLCFWADTSSSHAGHNMYVESGLKYYGYLEGALSNADGFAEFNPTTAADYTTKLRDLRYLQDDGKVVYVSIFFPSSASNVPAIGAQPSSKSNFYFSGRFRFTCEDASVETSATPFANDIVGMSGEPVVKINALPFRAYEAVYWSYFSNTQNQPFYVNGNPVYNKWNTTTADGADTTDYQLKFRNYEMDFLTSAMPSPQFGVAPVVGMTALGSMTITDENGTSTYQATVDNDGTITKVVATSPTASIEHARTAMNIAQVGMNINDFRATNSYQRFLETTLRKGYRYKDFILGHHDVKVKDLELDMPVYIGGVSQDVSVNMVSNMSAGQSMSDGQPIPLGEFAGTANCFGSSQHSVTHYCDDYGYILGVLTVVPDPAYSQLLPKHFLHSEQMSYYFNEFSQNGLQPITYKEVTPLTAYQDYLFDNSKLLTDTFGYQRPNYDLVGYTDQVHGLFRTDLKDFLIHRIFANRPELGTEFLEIEPKEVNDIFAYRSADSDTILGQVIVDIKAKRPIPRVVIPSLGR